MKRKQPSQLYGLFHSNVGAFLIIPWSLQERIYSCNRHKSLGKVTLFNGLRQMLIVKIRACVSCFDMKIFDFFFCAETHKLTEKKTFDHQNAETCLKTISALSLQNSNKFLNHF